MERRLSVGETLSSAFSIYRDRAGVLLPVAFWLFLFARIVEELTSDLLALFWLGAIVSLTAATFYEGMVVGLVREVQGGRRDSSIRDLITGVVPVFWRLLGSSFVYALGITGGLILLVVPGLYLLAVWAVVAPVIVVERRPVFDAFGRSRQLVRGNGWPVFWSILISFVLSAAASLALVQLADSIASAPPLRIVLGTLATTVTAPVAALVASVLYFRLREIGDSPAASDSSASAAVESPPAAS
ncbi:MAG: hypothetical protein ACJ75T_04070 [Solirubrobacterales bacterium]